MSMRKAAAFFFLTMLPLIASAAKGPKISFEKETHDYGTVLYGDEVKAEFRFTNTGDETLRIEKIRKTCDCTKAVAEPQEVPPGAAGAVITVFDTNGMRQGAKKKTIFVHTNDPARPVVNLTVLADVERHLNVNPPSLTHKLAAFAQNLSFPVKISNSSDKTVSITEIEVKGEGVKAALKPESVSIKPGAEAPLNVILTLKREPDRHIFTGNLVLKTDHAREKELVLRYFIQINKAE